MATSAPGGQIVVALDIGTTKICALVGDVDVTGVVHILGMGKSPSEGLRKGVVIDIEAASRNIRDAVSAATEDTGVDIHSVVVGVTGEHVSSTNNRASLLMTPAGREITCHDVERLMEIARTVDVPHGCEVIHVLPRGFSVDGQGGVRQPVGMHGSKLEVETHIVMGGTPFLQNVFKSVLQAGLHVDTVVLEPIATSEAVLVEAEKELGTLVADIGGGTTDIAIVVDGAVAHTSVIPVGGNHVTNDLAVGLKTSRAEAERLKLACGSTRISSEQGDELIAVRTADGEGERSITPRAMSDIIEPRMRELFILVRECLRSSGYDKLVAGVVLSGGACQLAGASELCEEIIKLPTRIGRPRNVFLTDGEDLGNPSYATAVGLLYFGAARHYRAGKEASTGTFLARAFEQLRLWVERLRNRT